MATIRDGIMTLSQILTNFENMMRLIKKHQKKRGCPIRCDDIGMFFMISHLQPRDFP
jgi:hypothetical protein